MTAYRTRGGTMSGQKMPSFTTLICDAKDCRTTPRRGGGAALLRKVARELGWVRVEGQDYCPEHVCEHGYVPGDHHFEAGTCGACRHYATSCSTPVVASASSRSQEVLVMTPASVGSVPNKPKTPLHSFRCPDDLWKAARAKAEERGENWSEELRKMVERYVKRRP